jgi:hypothetical protein
MDPLGAGRPACRRRRLCPPRPQPSRPAAASAPSPLRLPPGRAGTRTTASRATWPRTRRSCSSTCASTRPAGSTARCASTCCSRRSRWRPCRASERVRAPRLPRLPLLSPARPGRLRQLCVLLGAGGPCAWLRAADCARPCPPGPLGAARHTLPPATRPTAPLLTRHPQSTSTRTSGRASSWWRARWARRRASCA